MSTLGKLRLLLRIDRALRLMWQCSRNLMILNGVLTLIQGILPILILYLTKLSVDAITVCASGKRSAGDFRHITFLILLYAGIGLVGVIIRSVSDLINEAQSLVVTDHVQDVIHGKSAQVDLEYYENAKYYDTLHRAQQDAPFRPKAIVQGIAGIAQSAISVAAIAALLFALNPVIAVVLFIASMPSVWVRLQYADKIYNWQMKVTSLERQAWYYSWMLTRDMFAKDVRLFGLASLLRGRYRELRKRIRGERLGLATRRSALELATQAGATLMLGAAYLFVANQAMRGIITVGSLVMYFQAFQRGFALLQDLMFGVAGIYENNLFLKYYYDFLDLKPKIEEPALPSSVPKPMTSGIAFNQVSFRYPEAKRFALEDINITINPGEIIALVGENGSGKTTLTKLLCRLYEPTRGSITVDGIDLDSFNSQDWRREIGVIFQDYGRYNLSVQDNIWFGNVEEPAEEQQIMSAAKSSGAHDVVMTLDQQYNTILGKWFEDGVELSIGQWQKVALARAIYRNAQIIVLDEPTSSIDTKTEHEFFSRFRELCGDRTAILISHRFSTVRMADRIYVLEHGKILESGSHEELIRIGGKYAQLFEMQANSYR